VVCRRIQKCIIEAPSLILKTTERWKGQVYENSPYYPCSPYFAEPLDFLSLSPSEKEKIG
jgi:hypothetical protein